MKLFFLLGNQLFDEKYIEKFKKDHIFYMAEDFQLCTYEKHHKNKILLFLSSMRSHADRLKKSKFKIEIQLEEDKSIDKFEIKDPEINKIIEDLQLSLQSLNYKNKEIKNILPIILKEVDLLVRKENNLSFENLLKLAMDYLDKDSSNLAR